MTIDHDRLSRQIDEEAQRARTSELAPSFEQELHEAFAARAPRGAIVPRLDDLLLDVEERAFFDPAVPLASNRPGGAAIKKGLRTLMGFYVRHVLMQMDAFAYATGRALRAVAGRLESLEHEVDGVGPAGTHLLRDARDEDELPAARVEALWQTLLADARAAAPTPARRVEGDDALERLEHISDASLGAVMVGGDVEPRARGWKLRLVELVGRKAGPEATVVVVSTDPASWNGSPVVADLAPGRPFHAETWAWLLGREGFTDVKVARDDGPPASYAIVARRPAPG
jgi:hypothetical protein